MREIHLQLLSRERRGYIENISSLIESMKRNKVIRYTMVKKEQHTHTWNKNLIVEMLKYINNLNKCKTIIFTY